METKICCRCKSIFSLKYFSRDSGNKDGLRSYCRACQKEYKKKYLENNKQKVKKAAKKYREKNKKESYRWDNIWQKYRLRENDFNALMEEQNGLCKICEKKLVSPHIDHCHITEKVRGVLCANCNTGLGKLGDTSESLYKAYLYLKNFEESNEKD